MDNELDVIRRVIAGDTELFRLILQRYRSAVISMVGRLVNDRHLCEDVAQETFLSAYKNLRKYDSTRSEFSTWLFTIARNKSINVLKKKKPLPVETVPEKLDLSEPSGALEEKEMFARLDRALADLPVHQKTAFVMAELEGISYQQIAQIEGVRLGTVKSRINRAKARLARALTIKSDETK